MSRFDTRREAKLKQLAQIQPFVAASLCQVKRRCGNANCKCAHGEPHIAHQLTYKVKGKTHSVHVPVDMVEEVREWVQEHKRIKKLMAEVSQNSIEIIRRHVRASRAGGNKGDKKRQG